MTKKNLMCFSWTINLGGEGGEGAGQVIDFTMFINKIKVTE
jgi:diphthamide synthase (EF-2-diphthine--ammonia ligase)